VPSRPVTPDLDALVGLFHADAAELGRFDEITPDDMPPVARTLLAHEHHMTVTVEQHHGCPVDVVVLRKHVTAKDYAREILLTRQSDGAVVQYGIMRVQFQFLDAETRTEIESESAPLGRILIRRDILRSIRLCTLWQISPGPRLRQVLELSGHAPLYGRTALIYCNGDPAIELLEIVK
jgi:chorismate-pyruvate lyase